MSYRHRLAISAVVAVALTVAFASAAFAQSRPEATGLIEFETAVNWSEVSPKWKDRRAAWLMEVQAATSPKAIAALAIELESNMGWGSVQESWRQDRPGWLAAMKSAQSSSAVCKGLLALEAATKWKAVTKKWKKKRPEWVARMKSVAD